MSFRQNSAAASFLCGSTIVRPNALLLTIGAATALVAAAPAAQAQEGQVVAEVSIVGTKNTNPDAVRSAAALAGIKEGTAFRTDAFNKAKAAVENVGLYSSVFARTETTRGTGEVGTGFCAAAGAATKSGANAAVATRSRETRTNPGGRGTDRPRGM